MQRKILNSAKEEIVEIKTLSANIVDELKNMDRQILIDNENVRKKYLDMLRKFDDELSSYSKISRHYGKSREK